MIKLLDLTIFWTKNIDDVLVLHQLLLDIAVGVSTVTDFYATDNALRVDLGKVNANSNTTLD